MMRLSELPFRMQTFFMTSFIQTNKQMYQKTNSQIDNLRNGETNKETNKLS